MNLMRNKTIADIRSYIEESGYVTLDHEFKFAVENDAFKYLGHAQNNSHRYLIAFSLDEHYTDKPYIATYVFVFLGKNGNLAAEYASVPCAEFDNEEDLLAFVEKTCN
jgi:hypothetical protein